MRRWCLCCSKGRRRRVVKPQYKCICAPRRRLLYKPERSEVSSHFGFSMHHVYTIIVIIASIAASAPTYASGSCLSYGHSCWGAHGKRSSEQQPKWFISKLAPLPIKLQKAQQTRLAQLLLSQQPRTADNDVVEDVIISEDGDFARGSSAGERQQVVLMEQPPRIFQILKQLPRQADAENAIN
ncbi:uncharacterized protein isoform X2 [Rhodnius prolixus]